MGGRGQEGEKEKEREGEGGRREQAKIISNGQWLITFNFCIIIPIIMVCFVM